MMTEDEAVARMSALNSGGRGDVEAEHSMGDALVAEALRHLGWDKFADEYDKARGDWWYA